MGSVIVLHNCQASPSRSPIITYDDRCVAQIIVTHDRFETLPCLALPCLAQPPTLTSSQAKPPSRKPFSITHYYFKLIPSIRSTGMNSLSQILLLHSTLVNYLLSLPFIICIRDQVRLHKNVHCKIHTNAHPKAD
jgi:hypothetical protein